MGGRGAVLTRRDLERRNVRPTLRRFRREVRGVRGGGGGGTETATFQTVEPDIRLPGNITVRGSSDAAIQRALGRPLSRTDLAKMFGAPNNSTVTLTASGNQVSGAIQHRDFRAGLRIERRGNEMIYHGGSVFSTKDSRAGGQASEMVMRGIAYGASKGLTRVEVAQAIGSARDSERTGSLTWAKLGLNKTLTTAERASLPAQLRGAKDLNEVMLTKAGENWWRQNRKTFAGHLDLKKGSNGLKLARRVANRLGFNIRLKPSRANTQERVNERRARRTLRT